MSSKHVGWLVLLVVSAVTAALLGVKPARADTNVERMVKAWDSGVYTGYVGMRGHLVRDGAKIWVQRPAGFTFTDPVSGEQRFIPGQETLVAPATGDHATAHVVADAEYDKQAEEFALLNLEEAIDLLRRDAYEGQTFRNRNNETIEKPKLQGNTAYVAVRTQGLVNGSWDLIAAEYSVDPRQEGSQEAGTYLISRLGIVLAHSTGTIALQTDFIDVKQVPVTACKLDPQRTVTVDGQQFTFDDVQSRFENCSVGGLTLLAPLEGVEIDSSSRFPGFNLNGSASEADGRYEISYKHAPWIAFDENLYVIMRYSSLEPRIQMGTGLHLEYRKVRGGSRIPGLRDLVVLDPGGGDIISSSINQVTSGNLHIVNNVGAILGRLGDDTAGIRHYNVGIETAMLVATGVLYNEQSRSDESSSIPLGSEIPPGPVSIDDSTNVTLYDYARPPVTPPNSEYEADIFDRGLVRQISRQDLSDTDLYIFDDAGNQMLERRRLRANETDGLDCPTPTSCFLPPGDYDARFHVQTMVPTQGATSQLRIVLINRPTGYIGTGFATFEPNGKLPMIVVDDHIYLRPPNLKVKVYRTRAGDPNDPNNECGLKPQAHRTFLVGFEGSGLIQDQCLVIRTEWKDWDGRALPAGLPGYTGRIARVVQENVLGEDVAGDVGPRVGTFSILPGTDTHVIRNPSAVDLAHFYVHINGQPSERNPNFSELGAGTGALTYRPSHYVPFQVPIFDKPDDWDPREDPTAFHRWVYRPEMHYSLLDLHVRRVDVVTDDRRTDLLTEKDAVITGTINSVEIIYNLLQADLPELERFGSERDYQWQTADATKDANSFGNDREAIFTTADFEGQPLNPWDLVGVRLTQTGDEGNVLAEYGLFMDFSLSPAPEEDVMEVSADEPIVEVSAVANYGIVPIDPGSKIRWQFIEGSAQVQSPSLTNEDGSASTEFFTSTTAGSAYRLGAFLEEIRIAGRVENFGAEPRAATCRFVVIPGRATRFDHVVAGGLRIPADGATTARIEIMLYDQHNNLIETGRPVEWRLDGLGELDGVDQVEDGRVIATLTASPIPMKQGVHLIIDGEEQLIAEFEALEVRGRIDAVGGVTSVEADSVQQVQFEALFSDIEGHPVAAGTPVQIVASSGTLISRDTEIVHLPGPQGTTRSVARATFSAAETKPGKIFILASITGAAPPPFILTAHKAGPRVEVEHPGLVLKERVSAEDLLTGTVELETLGQPIAFPIHRETLVHVYGPPHKPIKGRLRNEFGMGDLLTIDGLQSDGTIEVVLDGQGHASVLVKRNPNVAFEMLQPDPSKLPHAALAWDLDSDGTYELEHKIGAVTEGVARWIGSLAHGFFAGEVADLPSFLGDIVASFLLWGDVRDLLLAPFKAFGVVQGEFQISSVILSALGVVPVLGLDQATGIIKAVLKRIPLNEKALGYLVDFGRRFATASPGVRAQMWNQMGRLMTALAEMPVDVVRKIVIVVSSIEMLDELALVCNYLGENARVFLDKVSSLLDEVPTGPQPLNVNGIAANAFNVNAITTNAITPNAVAAVGSRAHILPRMLKVLVTSPSGMIKAMAAWPARDVVEFTQALAKAMTHLGPEALAKVFKHQESGSFFLGNNYQVRQFMKDVAEVADISGAEKLLDNLAVRNFIAAHGFKYELQAAAHFRRNSVKFDLADPQSTATYVLQGLSRKIKKIGGETDAGDIDIVLRVANTTYQGQVKRSLAALKNLTRVKQWCNRAVRHTGGQFSRLRYIVPFPPDLIPEDIQKYFKHRGIKVIYVPEL